MNFIVSLIVTILSIAPALYLIGFDDKTSLTPELSVMVVNGFLFLFMWISGWGLSHFPCMMSASVILFTSIVLIGIDALSIYEDKSRFSEITGYNFKTGKASFAEDDKQEPPYCAMQSLPFGLKWRKYMSARKNALFTGISSHVLDVLTLWFAGFPFLKNEFGPGLLKSGNFWVWTIFCLAVAGLGVYWVWNLTKDGGPSDLRNKTEDEKCKKNRIMNDKSRGSINLFVSLIAIIAGWQGILSSTEGFNVDPHIIRANWYSAPITLMKKFFSAGIAESDTAFQKFTKGFSKLAGTAGPAIASTLLNQINSSFQFNGDTSAEMALPPCFD